jgi:hypothetical protein
MGLMIIKLCRPNEHRITSSRQKPQEILTMKSPAFRYLCATALCAFLTPAFAQMQHKDAPAAAGSYPMMQSMMKSMDQMKSMPTTGDIDKDFAMMMRVHHQGALEMADLELKSGKDPKMKAMAREIIEGQRKEIKEFDDWLAKHK